MQRCVPMKAGMFSSQFCQTPLRPWIQTIAGPSPPVSTKFISEPRIGSRRVTDGQSTPIHAASSPSAYVGSGPGRSSALRACATTKRWKRGRLRDMGLRYQRDRDRPAVRPPLTMRIAIDIDSTLHHYWDQLAAAAKRRFGVVLPYDDQLTWTISRLRPAQLRSCVEETHSDERFLAAEPYAGAVEVVTRWHDAGHFIHITSHRQDACARATETWLRRIGLPFDDLHCSF